MQPDIKTKLGIIFQFVIVYCLLFNFPAFLYHADLVKAADGGELFHANEGGWFWHASTAVMMLFWVFTLFFILSYSRALFSLFIPVIFVSSAIVSYGEFVQKAPVNDNIIAAAFQTNAKEAGEMIGWPLAAWVVFALILSGLVVLRYHRKVPKSSGRVGLIAIGGFFAAIAGATTYAIRGDFLTPWDFHPYDYTVISARYWSSKSNTEEMLKHKFDVSTLPAARQWDDKTPLRVVVGESVRVDHLGINGYTVHETTPLLAKEQNLISFRNVRACGTMTATSVPCLMTRATSANPAPALGETSFISIFRALGYKTAWISEQTKFLNNSFAVSSIAKEADEEIFEDNAFSKKTQNVANYFYDMLATEGGDSLLVFHMIGSHWFYEWRYPDEFRRYTPVCTQTLPNFCSPESLINSYDNTMLYLDSFLARAIDTLKTQNALLIYISDHGEYLGEKGRFLHGQETEDAEVRSVPMIIWTSDTFKRLHPDVVAKMEEKRNTPLSHDTIFHSVLDCAGITSEAADKMLSLCH